MSLGPTGGPPLLGRMSCARPNRDVYPNFQACDRGQVEGQNQQKPAPCTSGQISHYHESHHRGKTPGGGEADLVEDGSWDGQGGAGVWDVHNARQPALTRAAGQQQVHLPTAPHAHHRHSSAHTAASAQCTALAPHMSPGALPRQD